MLSGTKGKWRRTGSSARNEFFILGVYILTMFDTNCSSLSIRSMSRMIYAPSAVRLDINFPKIQFPKPENNLFARRGAESEALDNTQPR